MYSETFEDHYNPNIAFSKSTAVYLNSAWDIADASCPHQFVSVRSLLPFGPGFSLPITVGQRLHKLLAVGLCSLAACCLQ